MILIHKSKLFGPNVQCVALIKYSVRLQELLDADETRLLQNNLQLHIKLVFNLVFCMFLREMLSVRHDLLCKFFAVQFSVSCFVEIHCYANAAVSYFVPCDNLRQERKELSSMELM